MLSMLMIISRGAYGITKAIHIVDMRKTLKITTFFFLRYVTSAFI